MVVSTSRTGRVRPDDWVVLGSGKSLHTTATRAGYLRLLLAMTAQPRELASDSVIPRLPHCAADLSSVSLRTCHSVTVSLKWLPVAGTIAIIGHPSAWPPAQVYIVASWGRAWHAGREWQDRAGHGGSEQ